MPAGVSVGQYTAFMAAAFLSMALGAQTVHVYYRPMQNMQVYVEKEIEKLPPSVQEHVRESLQNHR